MHDHNNDGNKDGGHKGMLWMMIPCLLLLGVLFLGKGTVSSSGYLWPILIGAFVVVHIWMMFRGHGGNGGHIDATTEDTIGNTPAKQSDAKNEDNKNPHSGCCH